MRVYLHLHNLTMRRSQNSSKVPSLVKENKRYVVSFQDEYSKNGLVPIRNAVCFFQTFKVLQR